MINVNQLRGVVATHMDWAKLHRDRRNSNVSTSERLTDIGGGATFYSALVKIAKSEP